MNPREVPAQFLGSAAAPPARTLIDILHATARAHPEAAALDDGRSVLTYAELIDAVTSGAADLHALGVRRGDRVGVRLPSGSCQLYVSILSVLATGAAYVPVDADDPEERARLVFGEAQVTAVIGPEGVEMRRKPESTIADEEPAAPAVTDDAWIIFTSGSTGTPKGVAVSHRSAAAFVDAEARLFCRAEPLGPDDRVLAGLSVAFDASCEEMWLAWRHGACLVPAPRSLVRSGMDLGPWLIRKGITVVSTVPTLASLWPPEALAQVRLLIFGGEACPPELVARVATKNREVWNTYGPTEATVVACAAQLRAGEPVTIGLPLDGWDLAVVDEAGNPVAPGQTGELVIGGVGLARYLDPAKDREKYAPLDSLGWERAYRSGDHVRLEESGLFFVGRVDDQVKIGGRRIELGEVEAAVAAVPGVHAASVLAQPTPAGEKALVAYVSLSDDSLTEHSLAEELARSMPRALIPRIGILEELPVTTSGKVDKKALPWPLPVATTDTNLTGTAAWLAELWSEVLGAAVADDNADFFTLGGTSLAAATLISRIRERVPSLSVRDLYDHPRLGALAERIDAVTEDHSPTPTAASITPVPTRTRVVQSLVQVATMSVHACQWITCLLLLHTLLPLPWAQPAPWWLVTCLVLVFLTPIGRLPLAAAGARILTAGITSGEYPRGGRTHLRLWAAERFTEALGAHDISGATWVSYYARMLGADVGKGVDLHSLPPVTGLLRLGDHCAIEPEVDLSGYWIDGDTLHLGRIDVGAQARIGARATLLPGAVIGTNAHVEAGSCVTGEKKIKDNARWSGSPAAKVGRARHRFPQEPPPRAAWWLPLFGLTSAVLALLPLVALAAGGLVLVGAASISELFLRTPLAVLVAMGSYALLTLVSVRLLGVGLKAGVTPVRSRMGWQAWASQRLMDDARRHLFPLYASMLTPLWLRALGARVGRDVEISTVVCIPRFTDLRAGSFLADDTMVAGYELGGGWMRLGVSKIGKRSFLGNSSIAGPARTLSKHSLVAVLSSTPKKSGARSNWWGSPPERLRRVTVTTDGETSTYQPTWRVKTARGVIETLRLLAPITSGLLAVLVLVSLHLLYVQLGYGVFAVGGLVLIAAGALAAGVTIAVKWLCVGRIRPGEHPLWSRFVWLNELADTFTEVLAAPWFLNHTSGTAALTAFLRLMGARIGRGTWLESYWLPEADLCHIGDAATISRGCVVQTHLFQDRVMSLDHVRIDAAATLGPHSVTLPASVLGEGATLGPASLVMRGDHIPAHTRWQGNPIEPWRKGSSD